MGHELDSTDAPPGYDTAYLTAVGAGDWYDETGGLECTSCHTQHGIAGVYRNLGPRGLGTANLPTYTISTTNNTARDVWIRIDPTSYTPNSGAASTFSPFYDQANVFYNRVDKTVGGRMTSNGIDTQCSGCHGTFHGGTADTNIDPVPGDNHSFVRHPTSQETLNTGGSGTSNINRFRPIPEAVKVKVYTNDYTTYADASPGCVTCHKAHGNKNPFGLIFLSRTATTNNEEGGNGTELPSPGTATYQRGYRNLCGQCHGQGN
jgi:cytochrome c553